MKNIYFFGEELVLMGLTNETIAQLVSKRIGIINAILERKEFDKYGYCAFQSLRASAQKLFGKSREISSGGFGIHSSRERALMACIGEALERYCLSFYDKKMLVKCTYNEIPLKLRAPYLPEYPKDIYEVTDKFAKAKVDCIYWDVIREYLTGRSKIFWPASMIYMPWDEECKQVNETTSTGVAAGRNMHEAIIGGALEIVERDSIMINIGRRLNPPYVDIESLQGTNKKLVDKIRDSKFRIKIYRLYSDLNIPIYLSYIWKVRKGNLHFGIGACAALRSSEALEKSLKECIFTFFYSKDILDLRVTKKNEIKALYEHFLYYQDVNMFEKLLFTQSSPWKYKEETVTDQAFIMDLQYNGLKIYTKEITTPDIKNTKIQVWRTIIPGLIDINKTHEYLTMSERFWSVPKKINIRGIRGLWKNPHPFP